MTIPQKITHSWLQLCGYLFGSTQTHELPEEEVDDLLTQCTSPEAIDELYKFGRELLAENETRTAALDTKATTVVGFGGAILAFLILQTPQWAASTTWELFGISAAAICAAVACVYSFSALRGARDWAAVSERNWFPKQEVLKGPDDLKRAWIRVLHTIRQVNHRITNEKADKVIKAQLLLASAAVILGVTLASGAIRAALVNANRPSESGQHRASDCPIRIHQSLPHHQSSLSRWTLLSHHPAGRLRQIAALIPTPTMDYRRRSAILDRWS